MKSENQPLTAFLKIPLPTGLCAGAGDFRGENRQDYRMISQKQPLTAFKTLSAVKVPLISTPSFAGFGSAQPTKEVNLFHQNLLPRPCPTFPFQQHDIDACREP